MPGTTGGPIMIKTIKPGSYHGRRDFVLLTQGWKKMTGKFVRDPNSFSFHFFFQLPDSSFYTRPSWILLFPESCSRVIQNETASHSVVSNT